MALPALDYSRTSDAEVMPAPPSLPVLALVMGQSQAKGRELAHLWRTAVDAQRLVFRCGQAGTIIVRERIRNTYYRVTRSLRVAWTSAFWGWSAFASMVAIHVLAR